MKSLIKLFFLSIVLFFANCRKEDTIKLPQPFGKVKADLNGSNWDNSNYIVIVVGRDWNKVTDALECYKDKINIYVALYQKQFGYSRFVLGFEKITPKIGVYELRQLDVSKSSCENNFPLSTAGHFEADGDVAGSHYIIKEGSKSILELTECNFEKKILKGKFNVHLIQSSSFPKYPNELIFTNGEFETTIE